MMTDPIADMITRIRNATRVKKSEVVLPCSRLKLTIAKILEREGYLKKVETQTTRAGFLELRMELTYGLESAQTIHAIARISKPGRRVYVGYRELPRVANDAGLAIISTPQGVMTNKEARRQKLGGEILFEVY